MWYSFCSGCEKILKLLKIIWGWFQLMKQVIRRKFWQLVRRNRILLLWKQFANPILEQYIIIRIWKSILVVVEQCQSVNEFFSNIGCFISGRLEVLCKFLQPGMPFKLASMKWLQFYTKMWVNTKKIGRQPFHSPASVACRNKSIR